MSMMANFTTMGAQINSAIFKSPEFQDLLYNGVKFDLLIPDMVGPDSLLGLATHFNASAIAISTIRANPLVQAITGSPLPGSFVPNMMLQVPREMKFFDRLKNTLMTLAMEVIFFVLMDRAQEEAYNEMWPDPKPTYRDLKKEIFSLVLMNSHISLDGSQPLMTNIVEVGGMQINTKTKSLPDEYQRFMDSAKDGVILFSLGSNLEASFIDEEKRNAIVEVLSKQKEKVIMKWDHPESVKHLAQEKFFITKWLPQSDLLAHSSLKLFITHGGLGGLTETIYHGKPIVAIPVFADQQPNAENAKQLGIGIRLDYLNLTETAFNWAVQEVLENPAYTQRATELSERYRDRPLGALELAKFWVNYVIRHKGAKFLRSPAIKLNFFQYYSWDVYGFLVGALLLVLWIVKVVLTWIFRKIFYRNTQKKQKTL